MGPEQGMVLPYQILFEAVFTHLSPRELIASTSKTPEAVGFGGFGILYYEVQFDTTRDRQFLY